MAVTLDCVYRAAYQHLKMFFKSDWGTQGLNCIYREEFRNLPCKEINTVVSRIKTEMMEFYVLLHWKNKWDSEDWIETEWLSKTLQSVAIYTFRWKSVGLFILVVSQVFAPIQALNLLTWTSVSKTRDRFGADMGASHSMPCQLLSSSEPLKQSCSNNFSQYINSLVNAKDIKY